MIYQNSYFIFITFQLILFNFKNLNNNQKFIIISFILDFYKIYFFKKNNKILLIKIIKLLTKYIINSIILYIIFNLNIIFQIKIF